MSKYFKEYPVCVDSDCNGGDRPCRHTGEFRVKEFFVCPKCGIPAVTKERFAERFGHGSIYCCKCGEEIASAYAEALAEVTQG